MSNTNNTNSGNGIRIFLVILSCALLIFLAVSCSSSMGNGSKSVKATKSPSGISYTGYNKGLTQDEKGAALDFAKRLVAKKLDAPSTASYPWSFDEYEFVMNSGICTVKGHLDAQNVYGVKIRYNFESCFDMNEEAGHYKANERYTNVYPAK